MVVEVPARELAGRDAARASRRRGRARAPSRARRGPEHRVVDDLVQERRHVEEGEALQDRERDPDQRVLEAASSAVAADGDDPELARPRRRRWRGRAARVQRPQLLVGDRVAQLALEGGDLPSSSGATSSDHFSRCGSGNRQVDSRTGRHVKRRVRARSRVARPMTLLYAWARASTSARSSTPTAASPARRVELDPVRPPHPRPHRRA